MVAGNLEHVGLPPILPDGHAPLKFSWLDLEPIPVAQGPKYPKMKSIFGFCIRSRNDNDGFGYILPIWVLEPLGYGSGPFFFSSFGSA